MRVALLGAPGSGKGTQGALLAASLGVPYISSSELLRRQFPPGAALGRDVRRQMAAGELVADDVLVGLVLERLAQPDAQSGFVLDGFPRNLAQATALDDWLAERGHRLDAVILLEVRRDALIERLAERAVAQGRHDDEANRSAHRLEVYDAELSALVDYYARQGVLLRVNGEGSVAAVTARILAALRGPVHR